MGKVTLVGAGPGDASLITVKGLERIKTCDVIVYDRLVSKELLSYAKQDAVQIYVGKEAGAQAMPQEEINRILIEYGKSSREVVRLKGGDPFVFGRGGEEIRALIKQGIPFEVIPGVTSAVAVPELAGIPMTYRGLSRSFHVVTGQTIDGGELPMEQYQALARLEGTLVFLMGLRNIELITERLMQCKKDETTPAAVIADGATPKERIVRGTLGDIAKKVRKDAVLPPAALVIGETAAMRFRSEQITDGPKQNTGSRVEKTGGRIFGLTGTPETNRKFIEGLKNCGNAKDAAVPLLEMQTVRLPQCRELEREMERIAEYEWIFFTSKQAVELFFELYLSCSFDIRKFGRCRFAVIGSGTKQTLLAHGVHADFMPEQTDGDAFFREFLGRFHGGKILFPHALQCELLQGQKGHVPMPLSDILDAAGFEMNAIPVYDVKERCGAQFERAGELHNFVFFSASGVSAFLKQLNQRGVKLKTDCRMYCIGNRTRQALEQYGKNDAAWEIITAKEHTVEGLLAEIMENSVRVK